MDKFEEQIQELIDKVDGISDKTWEEIAEDLDLNMSADTIRRSFNCGIFSGYRVAKHYRSQISNGNTLDSIELNDLKNELYKERVRLQDVNREKRNYLREQARFENLLEVLKENIVQIPQEKEVKISQSYNDRNNIAVALLSDIHYGLQVDNNVNMYSTTIASSRLNFWSTKVIEYCQLYHVQTLNIVLCGDLISGLIKLSARVAQEEDVAEQIIAISEILSREITKINSKISFVNIYGVVGNHSRMNASKEDNIDSENFERLIFRYIELRTGLKVIDSGHSDYLEFNVGGSSCIATHGHNDKFGNVVNDFSKVLGYIPDYIYMGHTHHLQVEENGQTMVIVNGSVVGADDYAVKIRKYTKPSQVLHIISGNDDNIININLV
jgi:predicted phosphodiesterase